MLFWTKNPLVLKSKALESSRWSWPRSKSYYFFTVMKLGTVSQLRSRDTWRTLESRMPKPKSPRAPSLTLHLRESLFPSLMLPTRTVRLFNKMNDIASQSFKRSETDVSYKSSWRWFTWCIDNLPYLSHFAYKRANSSTTYWILITLRRQVCW